MCAKDDFYPFLVGERIYLREVRPSDVNDVYYCWMNDPEVTQYLEARFKPNSEETLKNYVQSLDGHRDNIFLAIVLKKSKNHIGNIKLGPIDWNHRCGDIGIIIGEKEQWGKGYASEAISLMTSYAFRTLNLHKVTAGAYEGNQGSVRAFEKAGFEVEGVRKSHFFYQGQYVDEVLLGMVNPEEGIIGT